MKRSAAALALVAFVGVGCARIDETQATPSPTVEIDAQAVTAAALTPKDMGKRWTQDRNAAPSTVQAGGRIGPANLEKEAVADDTSAFNENEGAGYVSASVYLMRRIEAAQAVMLEHQHADGTRTWRQDRKDGGSSTFRRTGRVRGLPALGDETYSATMRVTIESDTGKTERDIEYVAFRRDRVVAFVIAQEVTVARFAQAQEEKVDKLVT